eukprot:m.60901 g.60901  ORF g.60901 m.60901 type:complete len:369 (+) comp7311_c0_seq2:144-1250(+)
MASFESHSLNIDNPAPSDDGTFATCGCLNMTLQLADPIDPALFVPTKTQRSDPFFAIAAPLPAVCRADAVFEALVETRASFHLGMPFTIRRCRNCGIDFVAVSEDNSTMLANTREIKYTHAAVAELRKHESYSPAFGIVVLSTPPTRLGTAGADKAFAKQLKSMEFNFFNREKAAMERRIKAFIEAQEEELRELREKTQSDETALLRIQAAVSSPVVGSPSTRASELASRIDTIISVQVETETEVAESNQRRPVDPLSPLDDVFRQGPAILVDVDDGDVSENEEDDEIPETPVVVTFPEQEAVSVVDDDTAVLGTSLPIDIPVIRGFQPEKSQLSIETQRAETAVGSIKALSMHFRETLGVLAGSPDS